MSKNIIWDKFRKGCKEALQAIYKDNYSLLYFYGLKFTKDQDQIRDVIQELFVELIDSGSRLSSTDNIQFYLLKAFRNKLHKELKKSSKFLVDATDFSLQDSIEIQLIEEEMEESKRKYILSAIKMLSVKQQEIIYLRFYKDLTYQEIAELFAINIQTVRNLLSRAIKSIKVELQEKNIDKSMILMVLNYQL